MNPEWHAYVPPADAGLGEWRGKGYAPYTGHSAAHVEGRCVGCGRFRSHGKGWQVWARSPDGSGIEGQHDECELTGECRETLYGDRGESHVCRKPAKIIVGIDTGYGHRSNKDWPTGGDHFNSTGELCGIHRRKYERRTDAVETEREQRAAADQADRANRKIANEAIEILRDLGVDSARATYHFQDGNYIADGKITLDPVELFKALKIEGRFNDAS